MVVAAARMGQPLLQLMARAQPTTAVTATARPLQQSLKQVETEVMRTLPRPQTMAAQMGAVG